jgi:hypothetical protein
LPIGDCTATEETELKCFAGMVPMDRARQDWMMSTQRCEKRATLAMKIRRMVAWLGSRLSRNGIRASKLEVKFPSLPAQSPTRKAERRKAPLERPVSAATNSLQTDSSSRHAAKRVGVSPRLGSPPSEWCAEFASPRRSSLDLSTILFPAVNSRIDRTIPWAPAAKRRRTERYDGKRDLYFQHAA